MTCKTKRFALVAFSAAALTVAVGYAVVGRSPAPAPPPAETPEANPVFAVSAAHPAARLGRNYMRMDKCFFLSPYFFHHLAIDALRTGRYVAAAREYLLWTMSRLNDSDRFGLSGTIYDYVVCEGGAEISTLQYDSADGYAGQLLLLWAEYLRRTGDRETVERHAAKIRQTAALLLHLRDDDGLLIATTWHPVKYLMDNVEAYGGLQAFLKLGGHMGWKGLAEFEDAASELRQAIVARFYAPETGLFDWAIEAGKRYPSHWENYYPDALAQIFPVLYGVVDPQNESAQRLTDEFLSRYVAAAADVGQQLLVQRLQSLMRPDTPAIPLPPPETVVAEPPSSAAPARATGAAHPAARLGRHYASMNECYFLLAYEFFFMAIDALRTNRYVNEVKAFLAWTMGRINERDRFGLSGTIYDYVVCGDGEEISTRQYDAADSTAAQLLLLWAEYLRRTGDRASVARHAVKIRQTAKLLLDLQDKDGLIVAMTWHPVKYLMDNAEDYGGLQAFLELGGKMHWKGLAVYQDAAVKLRQAIIARYYAPETGLFDWAIEGETGSPSHWENYYPDGLAQIFPVLFGVVDRQSELARRLTDEFLARHAGAVDGIGQQLLLRRLLELMRPGESANTTAANGGPARRTP